QEGNRRRRQGAGGAGRGAAPARRHRHPEAAGRRGARRGRSRARPRPPRSRLHRAARADRRHRGQSQRPHRRLRHGRRAAHVARPSQRVVGRCQFQGEPARPHAPGPAGDHRGGRAPRRGVSRSRRQPGAGDRRPVQRAPGRERHRQFHQDRAARPGAHPARRRRRQARPPAPRTVGHRRRRRTPDDEPAMSAAAMLAALPHPAPRAELSPSAKIFAFAVMCIGFFIALLDIQIVSASLRDIGGGLSAGADETAWVQTSYLIAEIIVIPLSGWLSRVMSTRWLFSVSAAGFTAASLLCGWAWDIHSMIVFRALQGFLGGSMIPTVFTAAFAPTLGPTVGGWITDNYSWHWLFFVNLIPGIFVAVAVPMLVRIDTPNPKLLRGADYPG